MSLKIYTRIGDGGNTSLIGGAKVSKADLRIEAYGTVDELNSWLGLIGDQTPDAAARLFVKEIQDRLFTIGSLLANGETGKTKMKLPDLHESDVTLLEENIDAMTAALPPMKSFILPGGHVAVSSIHIARCVCRRAERLVVGLTENAIAVDGLVIQYLNRLSDYLFTLARHTAHVLQVPEVLWKARV